MNVSSECADDCDYAQVASFRPQARFEETRNYRHTGGIHTDRNFARPNPEKKINESEVQDDQIKAKDQDPRVRSFLWIVCGGYLGIGCRGCRCRDS